MKTERNCKDCQITFKPTRFAAFRCYDCTVKLKQQKVKEYYAKVSQPGAKVTRILGFKMKNLWHKEKEFLKACKELKEEMDRDFGYDICMICGTTRSMKWENHHIIYRSEAPFHENLHNKRNLIRICCDCHYNIHRSKENRTKLVNERKLWELFPEIYALQPKKIA